MGYQYKMVNGKRKAVWVPDPPKQTAPAPAPKPTNRPANPVGAATGAVSPKPTAGVYPGSGVASGGQQGRPSTVFQGIGGTSKGGGPVPGSTPAASNVKPGQPGKVPLPDRTPTPTNTGVGALKVGAPMADGWIFLGWTKDPARPGKYAPMVRTKTGGKALHPKWQNGGGGAGYGSVGMGQPVPGGGGPTINLGGGSTGGLPTGGGGGDMGGGGGTTGPVGPSPEELRLSLRDSLFNMGLTQAQQERDRARAALIAQQSELNARRYGVGGNQTLFEFRNQLARQDAERAVRSLNGNLVRQGLLRSGSADIARSQEDLALREAVSNLDREYGAGRLGAIQQDLSSIDRDFGDRQTLLLMEARDRVLAQAMQSLQERYGMALDPSMFVFSEG